MRIKPYSPPRQHTLNMSSQTEFARRMMKRFVLMEKQDCTSGEQDSGVPGTFKVQINYEVLEKYYLYK